MALSTKTLKQLRSDLRSRIGKLTQDEISDSELNYWLNLGQYDIASRLSVISDQWYGASEGTIDVSAIVHGTVDTITLGTDTAIAASGIMKLVAVIGDGGGVAGKVIPWKSLEELHNMATSSMYDTDYGVAHFGEDLYLFFGASFTMTSASIGIYYMRKPTEMASDSSTVDVPTEFADLVVLSALARALGKLNMTSNKQEVDADISAKLNDIRGLYANEVQQLQFENMPGTQTPRKR